MGMTLHFVRVSERTLKSFKIDSQLFADFLEDDDNYESPTWLDIGKSWGGLLYILTGQTIEELDTSSPLVKIMFNERVLDPEQDLGYGPAFYSEKSEVHKAMELLSDVSIYDLKKRFKPEEMDIKGVYPGNWTENADSIEYLLEEFSSLRHFTEIASENNEVIISVMS